MTYNDNRRQFLRYSLFGAAAASFPAWLNADTTAIKIEPSANFNPDIELEFNSQISDVPILNNGTKTRVQHYVAKVLKGEPSALQNLPDNYLGPILKLQQGQKVRVYYRNTLTEPSIIHWHGLHVPQKSDGHPMYTIGQGERFVYEFEVVNRAGTSFYHSHAHHLTAEQVYRGLAGMIVVSDAQEAKLDLPRDEYDLPLVIQDRSFANDGQWRYAHGMHERMLGFLGDTILVNGKPNAVFNVKSRAYRFRALNGSNSRIYKLAWDDGTPLTAIGTDAGLLASPETRPYIMLAPGERVDLWLDFSGRSVGSQLVMYSLPYSGAMPPMMGQMQHGNDEETESGRGMMGGMGMMTSRLAQGAKFAIATFKVSEKVGDSPKLPATLVKLPRLGLGAVDNPNQPLPIGLSMKPMRPQLNHLSFAMDRVADFERVALGSIKRIKIFHDHGMGEHAQGRGMGMGGGMGMMLDMAHPIHLHGQQFQVLSRKLEGGDPNHYATVKDGFIDNGWKDTVLVMPGETVEIIKPFQDYKGLFLFHCHNLEHEDLNMMRQFYVS